MTKLQARNRHLAILSLLSLALGLAVALAWSAGALEPLESALRDVRFRLRYRLQGTQPVDPRLALVVVDARSLDGLTRPYSLWSPQRVAVLEALARAGAKVIAPDLLWQLDPESMKGDPRLQPVYEELSEAETRLALLLLQSPVVLAGQVEQLPDLPDKLHKPRPQLYAIAGAEMPFLNLTPDGDGVFRRLPAALQVEDEGKRFWMLSFALRIAQLAAGVPFDPGTDLEPQQNPRRARFGEASVPLEDGRMWINYAGPAGQFRTFSFLDVLEHADEPKYLSRFENSVVLIGAGDPRLLDIHRSPFSRAGNPDVGGVEIHAQAANTLLTGRFLHSAPAPVQWLSILGLALLAGHLAFSTTPRGGMVLSVLVLAFWCTLAVAVFITSGTWLTMAGPLVAVPTVYGSAYIYRYLTVERDRRRLQRLFARYVPRQVAEELARDPSLAELGGASRRVTVLFSDINNFTPTCEKLYAQEVIGLLIAYFREMNRIIYRHEGTLRQFVGDEIMVIYGAPLPEENHALLAVQTAVDMGRRLEELKNASGGAEPAFCDVKIGIHTGDVVVGNVGSEERMEYTAVGDDVNLASRIMGLNKTLGTRILISEVTRREVGDRLPGVVYRSVGAQNFKGREQSMELFEVRWSDDELENQKEGVAVAAPAGRAAGGPSG